MFLLLNIIMSTLSVNLTAAVNYTSQPAQTVSLNGDIIINRIVDIPAEKRVYVLVEEVGQIELAELSGDNYDTPAEWTNADVVTAVKKIITT
tara:strand:- start:338 stop:613 length:276 start_codon:yes stop_codon:yes gene_type:complete